MAEIEQQRALPKFLALDASVLEQKEDTDRLRESVKLNRIRFEFPEGLSIVPVFEECRALCDLDDFDAMYDLTMQYLTQKTIAIYIINNDGGKTLLGSMVVPDKMADLRQMECISKFPWLVNWLTEFMAGYLSKKFPLPGSVSPQAAEQSEKTPKDRRKRR